ncbi:hypothetical protein Tco_0555579 [Tanacetum coccineum]
MALPLEASGSEGFDLLTSGMSATTTSAVNTGTPNEVLRDGLWMIRRVWVKFHDVPLVAYTSDGLSAITMKISTSMMLESYTNSMCLESWGQSSYARILIEIDA